MFYCSLVPSFLPSSGHAGLEASGDGFHGAVDVFAAELHRRVLSDATNEPFLNPFVNPVLADPEETANGFQRPPRGILNHDNRIRFAHFRFLFSFSSIVIHAADCSTLSPLRLKLVNTFSISFSSLMK